MDTIVTPVTVITLDSTRIAHSIKADLVARYFPPVVRLVQYDMSLPVIAVSLMHNGQTYTLPSGAAANIRVHKPDATYVYNPALGCDSTRNIVYFEVTQAMAAANGDGLAIVEIVVNGDIAGTSLITLHFEENPVPEDAIESSDEWETIYELGERIIASTVTPVSTAAGMTDHNVVYLYTGTESGWNQGHMYYYNGTTWVDAGIAVTDTTLSVAGLAADAKKTGDEIADLKDGLDVTDDRFADFTGIPKNIITEWVENSYVKLDGTFTNYNGWKRTNIIEIPDNVKSLTFYTDMSDPSQSGYNVYYDENKNKVTNFSFSNGGVSNLPSLIKYVAFSLPSRYSLIAVANPENVYDKLDQLYFYNKNVYSIPSYYQQHVQDRIETINTKLRGNLYRDAFIFFSDPHFPANNLASAEMIKAIKWNTNVQTVICGGDLVTMFGTQDTIDEAVGEFLNHYKVPIDDFYVLHGNHDYTIAESASAPNTGFTLAPAYVYDVMFRYLQRNSVNLKEYNRYYYFDHESAKIRYIAVDTSDFFTASDEPFGYKGVTPEQAEWFKSVLEETPNDMDIIVMSHIAINSNLKSYSQAGIDSFGNIVEAFNKRQSGSYVNNGVTIRYDFTQKENRVLMCINGHSHADQTYVSDTCLYYAIGADYPTKDDPNVSRTQNTYTDNLFDVILLRGDNLVETVRFGAGQSKTIQIPALT